MFLQISSDFGPPSYKLHPLSLKNPQKILFLPENFSF